MVRFTAGPRVVVKSASGLLRQVVEKLVRFQVVAVERDRVNWNGVVELGLSDDRLRRLKQTALKHNSSN